MTSRALPWAVAAAVVLVYPFVVPDDPSSKNFRVRDVSPPGGLDLGRFDHRRGLRDQLDRLERIDHEAAGDPVRALDEYYDQGYTLMASQDAQRAFDIHAEPDATRDFYGRNRLGQSFLLARRLVEAGVPFITLYEGGWDHHEKIFDGLDRKLPPSTAPSPP